MEERKRVRERDKEWAGLSFKRHKIDEGLNDNFFIFVCNSFIYSEIHLESRFRPLQLFLLFNSYFQGILILGRMDGR